MLSSHLADYASFCDTSFDSKDFVLALRVMVSKHKLFLYLGKNLRPGADPLSILVTDSKAVQSSLAMVR